MRFMLFVVLYGALMFAGTAFYIKRFYEYHGFVSTNYGDYNIRDRNGLLLILLSTWGMFLLLAVISFHILWFVATPLWLVIFYMQKKYIELWKHHGYSVKVFVFLNMAVIVLFLVVSPVVRNLIWSFL